MNNRFSNFRGSDFRPGQEEAIRYAQDSERRVVAITGPTGSGKSLIGMCVGSPEEKFAYVADTIQLQHQLIHDFPEARYMNGRKNFPCNLNPRLTADMCVHTRVTPCREKSVCEYEKHKRQTLAHPIQILNYRYLLVGGNYIGGFSDYPLIVCDEADLLESRLTQFIKLAISKHKLDSLRLSPPRFKSTTTQEGVEGFREWAGRMLVKVNHRLDFLRGNVEFLEPEQLSLEDVHLVRELKETERLATKLDIFLRNVDETWVFDDPPPGWVFQPTWLSQELAQQYFFRHGGKFLFMSATFPPKNVLCQTLGLNTEDVSMIEIPSMFPVSNRPVLLNPVADMSHKTFNEDLPKLLREILRILGKHSHEKGLIHTTSWKLAHAIMSLQSTQPRLISHENGDKRDALESFMRSKDGVFVSPSCTRGVDLPDDQCRFIIIAKCPFGDLNDKLVNKRMNSGGLGAFWYRASAAQEIVQASGRGVRHKDDYCITYLLDKQVEKLMVDNLNLFPGYWKESLDYA